MTPGTDTRTSHGPWSCSGSTRTGCPFELDGRTVCLAYAVLAMMSARRTKSGYSVSLRVAASTGPSYVTYPADAVRTTGFSPLA